MFPQFLHLRGIMVAHLHQVVLVAVVVQVQLVERHLLLAGMVLLQH
jgi:hypothetical protein